MLASTSRAVLRSSLGRASAFSTSAPARRAIVVELLQDIPSLGQKHDMVSVASGRARHQLIPTRAARYVPWKKAKARPVAWAAPRVHALPSDVPFLEAPPRTAVSATPEALLTKLQLVPSVLSFARLTISPVTPAIHGSVTLGDVQERLLAEMGITNSQVEVSWAEQETAARMKELGSWGAVIKVRGLGAEEVAVEVEVVREE